ncbi:MAG TPA: hypothetical protein VGL86_13130 [Polyangia bacterium]|jgi:hypothetical protein
MRTHLAALTLFAVIHAAHADAPQTMLAHVIIGHAGAYSATVTKSGDPTKLWVRDGDGWLALELVYLGPDRFHYEIKRGGERPFSMSGVVAPPVGKPLTIGHFPWAEDVKLWLTDR